MTGTTITIYSDDAPMTGLYIKWNSLPGEFTLTINDKDYTYGKRDLLHEYIELPESCDEATITILDDYVFVSDIFAFSAGTLPDWVQTWEDPYDEADILVFSAHSDDEILFMGPVLSIYTDAGYRVQVAYLCNFYITEPNRRHELLDGLWTSGIRHYPQLGRFKDEDSEDLETAKTLISDSDGEASLDDVREYVVETIRRFKPQVLVSHALNGEYGHGQHRLLAAMVSECIELAGDSSQFSSSASKYGTWNVPKTYLHLYEENQIILDTRAPLASFGGKNAYEIAVEAYSKHVSQAWMWFKVSDGYDENGDPDEEKYAVNSCAVFGLYRTLAGDDTGNDMMENLVSYDEQESAVIIETQTQDGQPGDTSQNSGEGTQQESPKSISSLGKTLLIIGIIVVVILLALFITLLAVSAHKKKVRRAKAAARRARMRRIQELNRSKK